MLPGVRRPRPRIIEAINPSGATYVAGRAETRQLNHGTPLITSHFIRPKCSNIFSLINYKELQGVMAFP